MKLSLKFGFLKHIADTLMRSGRYPFLVRTVAPILISGCAVCGTSLSASAVTDMPTTSAEAIERLNRELQHAKKYSSNREAKLDSLRFLLNRQKSVPKKWELAYRLGEAWLTFNADSALKYSREGVNYAKLVKDSIMICKSRLQEVRNLTSVGLLPLAQSKFETIRRPLNSDELLYDYLRTGRHYASNLISYTDGHQPYNQEARKLFMIYNDSLVSMVPESDLTSEFIINENKALRGHYAEALESLLKLMQKVDPDDNLYGMAAYRVAAIYRQQGDMDHYALNLALAAISDVRGAVKEGMALPELANYMYNQGELDVAYRFINFAFREASQSNARQRTLQMVRAMPMIDDAYRHSLTTSRDKLLVYGILSSVLLVLSVVLTVILWKAIKRVRANEARLAKTSKIQDNYIGHFVGLCSSYAERLDALSKLVTRKLASGQADELLKMVKNGHLDEGGQDEEFYKVFDAAFLDMYPDFVSEVNALLRPEEQIQCKDKRSLTSELRIYAMVRLGVDESTRIARILRYSVATVYAYRNKMRNRAIQRELFDENVMKIGH